MAPQTGKKIPFKKRLIMAVSAFMIIWAVRLVMLTVRHVTPNKDAFQAFLRAQNGEGVVLAGWHQRLFYFLYAYKRYNLKKLGPLAGLASTSGDGLLAARIARAFGFAKIVRGSSSRRGAPALLEMTNLLKSGWHAGLVLDAPRGPIYVAKPGVIALARLSGRPIVPLAWAASRYWQLKSWDKMVIPKPFCTIYGLAGVEDAVYVAADADRAACEASRKQLEDALFKLQKACDREIKTLNGKGS